MTKEISKQDNRGRQSYHDRETSQVAGRLYDAQQKMFNPNILTNWAKRISLNSQTKNIQTLTEYQEALSLNLQSSAKLKAEIITHHELVSSLILLRQDTMHIQIDLKREEFLTSLIEHKTKREKMSEEVKSASLDNLQKMSQLKIDDIRAELLEKFKAVDLEKLTASSTFAMDRLLNPTSNYGADITGREAIRDQMVEKMKRENLILEANIKKENADAEIKSFNIKKEIEDRLNED